MVPSTQEGIDFFTYVGISLPPPNLIPSNLCLVISALDCIPFLWVKVFCPYLFALENLVFVSSPPFVFAQIVRLTSHSIIRVGGGTDWG